jgi:TonB family protein
MISKLHFPRRTVWMTVLAASIAVMRVQGEPAPRVYEVPFLKGKYGVLFAPEPIYPYRPRAQRIEGRGYFELRVRPNGTVTTVAVYRSTGDEQLDIAAAQALIRWRFQPGLYARVRVPVRFVMRRR